MKIISVFLTTIFLISCSNFNQNSQDYYQSKGKMRHGIIPLTSPKLMATKKQKVVQKLDKEQVARGKQVYLKNCYNCHGIDGKGNGPGAIDLEVKPRNLVKVVQEVPNFKFFMAISQWQGKMPGWVSALNEQELEDVNIYIQHLGQTQK